MTTKTEEIELLHNIKDSVIVIEPEAEVILYGSRARGTSTAGSDWDFLILVPHDSPSLRQTVRRRLYEIEWASGEVISVVLHEKRLWKSSRLKASPFHRNVEKEGVRL